MVCSRIWMPSGSWTATTSLAAVHHRPVRDAEGIQVGQPGVHFGVARDRLVWPPACWRSLSSCDLTCRLWFGCEDGLCGIMSFDQEQPDPNKGRDEQSRRPSPRRSHRAVVAVSPRVLLKPDPVGGCVVCAGRGGAVRRWTSKDAGGSVADPPRLDRTQIRDAQAADRWTRLVIARAHPAPPRPAARQRSAPTMATTRPTRSAHPARVRRGFRNSARRPPAQPVHQNPASPAPDGHPVPPTAVPHPITTSGKRSNARPHSPPDSGRQLKRQAQGLLHSAVTRRPRTAR